VSGSKEEHRPQPWPELDQVEDGYEDDLKRRWQQCAEICAAALKLNVADILLSQRAAGSDGEKGPEDLPPRDAFTFSGEQRRAVMAAMRTFTGEYRPGNPESPVSWYYGQAYSLGLLQAARMIGKERPVLDLIKNREIFGQLATDGFQLVKDNATRAIVDKIIPEMEAFAIAGANPLTVAARLKQRFGEQNSNWRRLARTEMSMAAESAKLNEWAAWSVQWVEFTPAPDGCPACMALAGDYPIANCPVAGRDTHPHCRCSTRPAKRETGVEHQPPEAGLAARFEVNDIDTGLHSLMLAFDRENPGLFVRGYHETVEVSEDYFMATNCHGRVLVSNQTFMGTFNPASSIKAAMTKIKAGLHLSFEEEYAIESLWHEVCHNRATQYRVRPDARGPAGDIRVCMEALNQLVARHTYPSFMVKLGGTATRFEEILANGYGYSTWVRNLRRLIAWLGVGEQGLVPEFEKILFEKSYSRVKANLSVVLAERSGKERSVVEAVLGRLYLAEEEFAAVLQAVA